MIWRIRLQLKYLETLYPTAFKQKTGIVTTLALASVLAHHASLKGLGHYGHRNFLRMAPNILELLSGSAYQAAMGFPSLTQKGTGSQGRQASLHVC